ncbi:MAG: hypothetical protein A3A83_02140 [Candidatus Doudnabacteria bacterium RIFCSPLOWO2_01_FULL_48_57]|nr:MAG: hypothetical protein A3A83_02140 [Candidatus Doudnabacteria bacterium RIFCSPLOWO2_01_FULL_48_57]
MNDIKQTSMFWKAFSEGKVLEKYLYGNEKLASAIGKFIIALIIIFGGLILMLGFVWLISKIPTRAVLVGVPMILLIVFIRGLIKK